MINKKYQVLNIKTVGVISVKNLLIIAISIMWLAVFEAQGAEVFDLPFGITMSNTSSNEIASKGVCIKKFNVLDQSRCQAYDMYGKFTVFMSQNDFVSIVQFKSRLPRSWREKGFSMNMNRSHYINTLDNYGIKYSIHDEKRCTWHKEINGNKICSSMVSTYQGENEIIAWFDTRAQECNGESYDQFDYIETSCFVSGGKMATIEVRSSF